MQVVYNSSNILMLSQVHCIVALLRLHRKHILRLKAPEDFVQVSAPGQAHLSVLSMTVLQSACQSEVTALLVSPQQLASQAL